MSTAPQHADRLTPDEPAWWRRTWLRLTVCFVMVLTLPLVVTAIYTTRRHLAVVRHVAAEAAADQTAVLARGLEDWLADARNDLLAVAESPVLESFLSATGPDGGQAIANSPDAEFWRQKLVRQLRTLVDVTPTCRSLTITDESGEDWIRIERQGTATHIVETPTVEGSAAQPWLVAAQQLLQRQTTVHLVDRGGQPNVVFATRVRAAPGRPRAIVSLELSLGQFLQESLSAGGPHAITLLDDQGLRLFSSGSEAEAPAAATQPSNSPAFIDPRGRLVNVAAIGVPSGQSSLNWRLASIEPAGALEAGVHDFRVAFLALLAAALVAATLLSVWLARQFTRPVRELYEASHRIGRGEFDVDLRDTTGDEFGALFQQVGRMTEQLRAAHEGFEQRLQEKTEQLVQAERLSTIGRTAAAVAHEINNPCGIIALYAQMLTESASGEPNASQLEKLRVIEQKAREISRIVDELLAYARKPEPQREWTDTAALVRQALAESSAVLTVGAVSDREVSDRDRAGAVSDREAVRTSIAVDPEAQRLYADPHQLVRVMRNLINNAYHAMAHGGELAIRCHRRDGWLEIEVNDTGTGMSPEDVAHAFEPFYTTKRFGAGTGLGLAISREIVERHGGRIDVASAPQRGTRVTISLPAGNAGGWHGQAPARP